MYEENELLKSNKTIDLLQRKNIMQEKKLNDWLKYISKQDDFSKVIEQNKDLNNAYETLMALCEKERILWGVKSDIPVIRKIGFGTWIIL